ncbi:hypothetical protein BGY98DRAFT_937193 [Russula aff. rugulosa BPL654]|nr:hypothetical protein BGY98DRAFT_937193 [Russula aff. rugulosa BPL654]
MKATNDSHTRKNFEFFITSLLKISPYPEASQFAKDDAHISTPLMADGARVPIRPRPSARTAPRRRRRIRVDVDPSVNEYCAKKPARPTRKSAEMPTRPTKNTAKTLTRPMMPNNEETQTSLTTMNHAKKSTHPMTVKDAKTSTRPMMTSIAKMLNRPTAIDSVATSTGQMPTTKVAKMSTRLMFPVRLLRHSCHILCYDFHIDIWLILSPVLIWEPRA